MDSLVVGASIAAYAVLATASTVVYLKGRGWLGGIGWVALVFPLVTVAVVVALVDWDIETGDGLTDEFVAFSLVLLVALVLVLGSLAGLAIVVVSAFRPALPGSTWAAARPARRLSILLPGTVVAALGLAVGFGAVRNDTGPALRHTVPGAAVETAGVPVHVIYEITASDDASLVRVRMLAPSGRIEEGVFPVPHSEPFTFRARDAVSLSARLEAGEGEVTCRILISGVVEVENTRTNTSCTAAIYGIEAPPGP